MKSEKRIIQLHSPNIFGNELKYLRECIKSNHLTFGKHSQLFLKKIQELTKSKHPSLVQNCTSGLYLCLKISNTKKNNDFNFRRDNLKSNKILNYLPIIFIANNFIIKFRIGSQETKCC